MCHRMLVGVCLSLTGLLATAAAASAQVVGFRGNGSGIYQDCTPVSEWGLNKNVLWRTALPGESAASPLVVGDRVLVCAEPDTLLCLDANDGKLLWQTANPFWETLAAAEADRWKQAHQRAIDLRKVVRTLRAKNAEEDLKTAQEELDRLWQNTLPRFEDPAGWVKDRIGLYPVTNPCNGYASATPVSDGRHVWTVFATGVIACHDLGGTRQWLTHYPPSRALWHGHSSSPVLCGKTLVVFLKDLIGIDPGTGKLLWKAEGLAETQGSLVQTMIGGQHVVITPNADFIRVSDGQVLANRVIKVNGTWDFATPVVEGGAVFFAGITGRALKLPIHAEQPFATEMLWEFKRMFPMGPVVGSPALFEGLFYTCSEQSKDLLVVEAATGKEVYRRKLDMKGRFFPSLSLAGGMVFISSTTGETLVIKAGRQYQELARNSLDDGLRASLVFSRKRIYIRTDKALWCIGQR